MTVEVGDVMPPIMPPCCCSCLLWLSTPDRCSPEVVPLGPAAAAAAAEPGDSLTGGVVDVGLLGSALAAAAARSASGSLSASHCLSRCLSMIIDVDGDVRLNKCLCLV